MNEEIRKLTVRLYDSKIIERLDELWLSHTRLYRNKNSFIVDIIIRGIESVENELSNIKEMYDSGNIFKELKRLTSLMDRVVDVGYENYKESFIIGKENQVIMSRLYNMIFQLAKEKGVSVDKYNAGFFDELPENFGYVTDALIKEFKARDNT